MAFVLQDVRGDHEDYPECFICYGRLKEPYIRCSECRTRVQVCLHCFCVGGESGSHSNSHSYEILSNTFSVLEESWTAEEEISFLDALADCGMDNWAEVSKQMQTKSKEECESHYNKCYIQEAAQHGFPVLRCQTEQLYQSRAVCPVSFKASEDPPRPPIDSLKSMELAGYIPCRGDFDVVKNCVKLF
ncbi:hypothetical protein QZH41_020785 [Actinostola sp. cb2023]|nr:hypothetical protein QZH41_020785 [Actinostola sp. cb2023]